MTRNRLEAHLATLLKTPPSFEPRMPTINSMEHAFNDSWNEDISCVRLRSVVLFLLEVD